LLSFCGCVTEHDIKICNSIATKRINVESIFFHESNDYTFFIKDETNNIKTISSDSLRWQLIGRAEPLSGVVDQVNIFDDVNENEKSYIVLTTNVEGYLCNISIDIHTRLDRIQGGKWNHGKFGSGQTVKIQ
jgi:hypothetical protein